MDNNTRATAIQPCLPWIHGEVVRGWGQSFLLPLYISECRGDRDYKFLQPRICCCICYILLQRVWMEASLDHALNNRNSVNHLGVMLCPTHDCGPGCTHYIQCLH